MRTILSQFTELREPALRALCWLTCARRKLTAKELQHAIATQAGKSEIDTARLLGTGTIASACHGLVIADEDDTVRFTDDDTKAYFRKRRNEWFPEAEYEISGICATYLSLDVFNCGICQTDDEFEERLRWHALYEYAARNWGHHCRDATTINGAVTQFLSKKYHVEAASQVLMTIDVKRSPGYSQKVPRQITGLHLAAYFGVKEAVQQLLSQISPSTEDSYNRTPLWYARATNQHATITLLVDKSEDTVKSLSNISNPFEPNDSNINKIQAALAEAELNPNEVERIIKLGFTDFCIPMDPESYPLHLGPSTYCHTGIRH